MRIILRMSFAPQSSVSITALVAFVVFFFVPFSANSQIPTSGLLGLWKFDEGTGLTASNSSGSGASGTLVNGPAWSERNQGFGLNFDGIDDHVKVIDPSLSNLNTITISAWANARSSGGAETGSARLISKSDSSTSARFALMIGSDGTSIQFNVGYSTTAGSWKTPSGSFPLNSWRHMVASYDFGNLNNVPKIYINGIEQTLSLLASPAGVPVVDDSSLYVGSRGINNLRVFDGVIDEVRFYNRVFTQGDVDSLYNGEKAPGTIASSASFALPTTNNFILNPERGFFTWTDISDPNYLFMRGLGHTLTRPYYRLDAYRTSPLPQSFLNQLNTAFQNARNAGIKIILRFSYNFPPCVPPACPLEADATVTQIQSHLQQLAPIMSANEDVINSMEAGFIGLWGEWHQSLSGSDTPAAKQTVINSILAALPPGRMVGVRMPFDIRTFQGNSPISTGEAYSGTNKARIGSHQDCFLASNDDWGTWGLKYDSPTRTWIPSGFTIQQDKDYINQNGLYSVVGGETCNVNPPRSDCATALSELSYLRFSYLNKDYEPNIIQGWKDQGCFDEINRRLGYRFELVNGSHSNNVLPGTNFQLNLSVFNRGFASLFNARPAFAVLVDGANRFAFPLTTDPRRWAPNTTTNITENFTLPTNIPPGTYSLALWLPDQAASIRTNSQYAVRFANQNIWSGTDGYNILSHRVVIRDIVPPRPPTNFQ